MTTCCTRDYYSSHRSWCPTVVAATMAAAWILSLGVIAALSFGLFDGLVWVDSLFRAAVVTGSIFTALYLLAPQFFEGTK